MQNIDIRRKLFGEEHSSTADSHHLFGVTQSERGNFTSAIQSFQRELDIRLQLFGEKHTATADSKQVLCDTQMMQRMVATLQQAFESHVQSWPCNLEFLHLIQCLHFPIHGKVDYCDKLVCHTILHFHTY